MDGTAFYFFRSFYKKLHFRGKRVKTAEKTRINKHDRIHNDKNGCCMLPRLHTRSRRPIASVEADTDIRSCPEWMTVFLFFSVSALKKSIYVVYYNYFQNMIF